VAKGYFNIQISFLLDREKISQRFLPQLLSEEIKYAVGRSSKLPFFEISFDKNFSLSLTNASENNCFSI